MRPEQRHNPGPASSDPALRDARQIGDRPPGATGARKWLFRLAALVLLPLALLGGIEGGLRWAGYGYPTSFFLARGGGDGERVIENARFGWRFFGPVMARAPGVLSLSRTKAPDTVRVFVLGESAAYGDPQPAFGMPRQLEVLLRARYPGTRFEVVNAAMTAINSHVILPIARDCARLPGDVWVVYMGNNEVIGPYGAGTVFGPQAPNLAMIRASVAFKATRTGQLVEGLLGRLLPNRLDRSEWGGMMMFMKHQVRQSDPRAAAVYAHFERNLADILRTAARAGVRTVVSTVASNLKDCAPFASLHRDGLNATLLAQWNQFYQDGRQAYQAGRATDAIALFGQASQIDDDYAELHFLWGQCCLGLGQEEEARRHFTRARDQDVLRFRADSPINEIIRKTASGREAEGVFFTDAEQALAAASPHGLPGNELLFEHVHLNFEGNYLLARTIADQVAKALPETVARRAGPQGDWLAAPECARRLAFAGWNRYEGLASILLRLNDPPFTSQFGHAERYRQLQQQLEELQPALAPPALKQALADDNQARALAPDDWRLDENLGRLLAKLGDWPAAANAWGRVAERVPHDADALAQQGIALLQSGQHAEATRAFESVLRLDPQAVPALDGIGRALAKQGKTREAIVQFEKVLRLKPHYCETLINLGLALNALGKSEEAKLRFREALVHKPNSPAALIMLAKICHAEGWLAESVTNFSAALRLNPVDAPTELDLGVTLAAMGRYAEAGTHYAEAVRLDPNSAPAHFRLGFEMGRQGKSGEAIEQFTHAVRLKGDFLEARLNLGVALLKLGRSNEAQVQLEEARRIDPGNATVKKLLGTMGK